MDSLGGVHLTYYDGNEDVLIYVLGTPVPEPAAMTLLAMGLGALAALRRRRSRLRE